MLWTYFGIVHSRTDKFKHPPSSFIGIRFLKDSTCKDKKVGVAVVADKKFRRCLAMIYVVGFTTMWTFNIFRIR
jgi:hypothetical protein